MPGMLVIAYHAYHGLLRISNPSSTKKRWFGTVECMSFALAIRYFAIWYHPSQLPYPVGSISRYGFTLLFTHHRKPDRWRERSRNAHREERP